MSILKVSEIQSNAVNTPPLIEDSAGTQVGTFCRAWVNFNGQGTVAIRGSFNVLGITDLNTGHYRINYTNQMIDENYAPVFSCITTAVGNTATTASINAATTPTVSSVEIRTYQQGTGFADPLYVNAAVFR